MTDWLGWGKKKFKDAADGIQDAASDVSKAIQKETETQRAKHQKVHSPEGTVAKATEELNVVEAHGYYKSMLGADLQPHLKDDGKITNEETVDIMSDIAVELVDAGHLTVLPGRSLGGAISEIKAELSGAAESAFDNLNASEKAAFATLIKLPEDDKQAMLRKVEAAGGLPSAKQASVDGADAAAGGYVLVDGTTGEPIEEPVRREDLHASTVQLTDDDIPYYISADDGPSV